MPRLAVVVGFLALLCAPQVISAGDADKKDVAKVTLTADEQTILDLTNKARAEEKLPLLKMNPTLTEVARAHSKNMAKQGKMDHELDGKKPSDRVNAAGYNWRWVGENIASGEGSPSADEIFKGWMNSPHHKENILRKEYKEIGIGIATNEKGETYFTQVFGTRKSR
jgi:uncharacterized protein YkwD